MTKMLLISSILSLLISCKTYYASNDLQLYPINKNYFSEVKYAINRLEKKVDTFAYLTIVQGNCDGPAVSANSKLTWIKNGKSEVAFIIKLPSQEEHNMKITNCDNIDFFNYFLQNRVDTCKSFPEISNAMSPGSECFLMVKCNKIEYSIEFDSYKLSSSHDTLHPLYTLWKLFDSIN